MSADDDERAILLSRLKDRPGPTCRACGKARAFRAGQSSPGRGCRGDAGDRSSTHARSPSANAASSLGLGKEPLHRAAIGSRDAGFRRMSPARRLQVPPTITSRTADPGANRCESSRTSPDLANRLGCSGSSTTRSARKPGVMRPAGRPAALAPPSRAAPQRAGPQCGLGWARCRDPSQLAEALPLFQQPQLCRGVRGHVAVRADAELPAMCQMLGQREYPVAEIGLR